MLNSYIKNGIDINLLYLNTDYENSDFVFANSKYYSFLSKCNSKEKAQLLISNGINIDIDCGNGITPLMQYIESGYIYRDSYNHTWGNNSKEIIKLLLKNGADVNHKLENGVTPLLNKRFEWVPVGFGVRFTGGSSWPRSPGWPVGPFPRPRGGPRPDGPPGFHR